jgi:low affinity Fe/Cu permease
MWPFTKIAIIETNSTTVQDQGTKITDNLRTQSKADYTLATKIANRGEVTHTDSTNEHGERRVDTYKTNGKEIERITIYGTLPIGDGSIPL